MLKFTVNKKEVQYNLAEKNDKLLLDFLREDLGLTGTKRGCDEKACGACMVLIDGVALRSCVAKVSDVDGKEVVTIEGLADNDKMDPVQRAFADHNAVQCGFCTPGMVMAVHSLIAKNPNPTNEDIVKGLRMNLCRCGTYPRVIAAAKQAAAEMRGENFIAYRPKDLSEAGSLIGKSMTRVDVPDKLMGKTKFYADYQFPNMMYGKAVYSEHAHANIISIDTSEAEAVEGVEIVITAKDIPGKNIYGVLAPDQPVLCDKRVKYLGDMVAAVFADDVETAEKAAELVKVEYEVLPGIFSVEEALKEDAILIPSPENGEYWNANMDGKEGNVCKEVVLRRGSIEEGFKNSDVIIDEKFTTPREEHAWIEVDGALAAYDEGVLTVYAPNQSPFADLDQLKVVMGMTEDEVRIVHLPAGGAFGGKTELTVHSLVAIATMKTGRPSKMVLNRKDSIRTHPKRHPYDMQYKIGATKDGKIQAMQIRIMSDAGAYISWTPRVLQQSTYYSTGPYYVPNLDIVATGVYTNNVPSGAMRGFGAIQTHFGAESAIDMLAEKLGMDPIEIREINGLELGLTMASGQLITDKIGVDYKNTLKDVRKVIDEELKPLYKDQENIGFGIASGWRSVAGGLGPVENAGATFELMPDGRVSYRIACTEMGQGSHTSLMQMASEVSGTDFYDFDIVAGDTKNVPYGGGVMASRGLFLWGHPTIVAGKEFKSTIIKESAKILDIKEEDLDVKNSSVVVKDTGEEKISFKELAKKVEKPILVEVDFHLPESHDVPVDGNESESIDPKIYNPHHTVAYNTTVAVVRVNPDTGAVELLNITEVCDGGRIINPDAAATQIEGAIVMGAAYGMTNNFKLDKGVVVTDTLGKCKVPRINSMPDTMGVVFTKAEDPTGPFGSKGVAEIGVLTPAPAITNAIYDAIGVRVKDLPVVDYNKIIKDAALNKAKPKAED